MKLAVAGTLPQENESFLEEQKTKITAAGLDRFVVFRPNLSREEKINFLAQLTLFCVPARLPEAFGLYVIESMAAGVPVVLPDHGSFSELINETKGGVLYAKDEPIGLVNALNDLLSNTEQAKQFAEQGKAAVHEKYSNEVLARRLAKELVENILAPLVSTK